MKNALIRFTTIVVGLWQLIGFIISEAYRFDVSTGAAAVSLPRRPRKVSVGVRFSLVFCGVLLITILSGIGNVVMASAWTEPTALQSSAFDNLATAWKMGTGALIGLLSGKTVE